MRLGGRPLRRWAVLVVALAVIAAGGALWLMTTSGPAPIRTEVHRIQVVDGPKDDQRVTLDTTFYRPSGGGRAPAVLLAHGFGGSKDSVRADAEWLARSGFAVLTWSARGFGGSTGQIALNSPDYEVKDTRQLIDWLAKRPDVRLDRGGDPRVGITGESYGGAIALLTAAYDDRVDAIAPQITWHDLADSLFPNAATGTARRPDGVFKKLWAGIFFTGSIDDTGDGSGDGTEPSPCGRFLPSLCAMYQEAAETGLPTEEVIATLRRSSPSAVEQRIKVPSLLVQGQADSLFPLDQADANARAISRNGAPVSVVWFQGGHDGGDPETERVRGLVGDWFSRWLRDPAAAGGVRAAGSGDAGGASGGAARYAAGGAAGTRSGGTGGPGAQPGFTVTRAGGIDSTTQQVVVQAASTRSYPGLSAQTRTLALSTPRGRASQTVFNPAGGSPASVSAVPGLGGLGSLGDLGGGDLASGTALDMPGQVATFDTAALAEPLQVTGTAKVRLKVSAAAGTPAEPENKDASKSESGRPKDAPEGATLFAKLYDVGPSGRAVPARRLAAPIRVATQGAEAEISLPALDYRFDRGHRLRVVLTTTDMGFATTARPAGYRISVTSGLTVPTVPTLRAPAPPLPWWTWALPAAGILAAAAILLTGRGRRAGFRGAEAYDETLQDVPLEITGLTKSYGDGRLAVDELSFRVDKGQVLGLLGPNGAGKTTTLRMLMGLIHPDAGEIRIFGHRVTPGTAALARLGSFVEGPGFLPHLSGRDNLDLYWRATGRPRDESHVEEALRIADLGSALDRAVRTYSQGMRQRLAIAQAMLGLPDLLVLDEPTNGLDPPQIREMRDVLVRYAQDGRTVIVSSHLLAEVEQTCTHVVVMSQGRRVAAGPVAEIVGSERRLEDAFLAIIGEDDGVRH